MYRVVDRVIRQGIMHGAHGELMLPGYVFDHKRNGMSSTAAELTIGATLRGGYGVCQLR